MDGREEFQAQGEALDEISTHPDRSRPHESAISRFVAGIAYEERRHEQAASAKGESESQK